MAGWRSKEFRDGRLASYGVQRWLAGVLRGSEMAGWRSKEFRDGWLAF
jgi:hypothetical protein